MDSISDQRGYAAGANLAPLNTVRQNQVKLGDRNLVDILNTQFIRTDEQNQFKRFITSSPAEGLSKINQLGFGLFNGGGLFLPLPLPASGSKVVRVSGSRTDKFSLGELLSVDYETIGFDGTDTNGNSILGPSWLSVPVANPGCFTNVTAIPRPILNQTLSKTPLASYIPGNVCVSGGAASYNLDINSSVRLTPFKVDEQLSNSNNLSSKLDGLATFKEVNKQLTDYISGKNGFYLIDSTNKIPTLFLASSITDTEERENGKSLLAEKKKQLETWLGYMEDILKLPVKADLYRENVYCSLKDKASQCWSGSNGIAELTKSLTGLEEITDIQKAINDLSKWVPVGFAISKTIFETLKSGESANLKSINVGDTKLDVNKLSLNLEAINDIRRINSYLPDNLKIAYTGDKLLSGGRVFNVNEVTSLDSSTLEFIGLINSNLPDPLKWKTYKDDLGEIKAFQVTKNLKISSDESLTTKIGYSAVDAGIDYIKNVLPPEVSELIDISTSEEPGKLFNIKPISREDLEAKLTNYSYEELLSYVPEELKSVISKSPSGGLNINSNNLAKLGVEKINDYLPSGFKLDAVVGLNGSIDSIAIGPVSLNFKEGALDISLDNLSQLTGGFELLDIVDSLPFGKDELKSIIGQVKLPFDKKSINNSSISIKINETSTGNNNESIASKSALPDLPEPFSIKGKYTGGLLPLLKPSENCSESTTSSTTQKGNSLTGFSPINGNNYIDSSNAKFNKGTLKLPSTSFKDESGKSLPSLPNLQR
jgi:hypothetical protein